MSEKIIALLFLLFSLIYITFASELSFGALYAPKAGFLPLLSGIAAIVLSLAVMARQVLPKQQKKADVVNWRKCILVITGMFIYLIGLKMAGYFIATFAVMLYWLKISDTAGWTIPCFISAGVAVLFQLVFGQCLGIHLP